VSGEIAKTIIIDGAHNPQKMQSVVDTMKAVFPKRDVTVLIAMKEDKDQRTTISELTKISKGFVVTSFFNKDQDFVNLSADPESLADTISNQGAKATVIKDPADALHFALKQTKDILLVTGSFYFIGEIYSVIPAKAGIQSSGSSIRNASLSVKDDKKGNK
jgi:dihydrofolate synthase / folylpolyglutamate synthase